uniref:Receptor-like serine/threonine-protein kinase n=1 Tax=Fagus sylvatica TaxID=28930 RepID=A0A2N9H741_FAGSY
MINSTGSLVLLSQNKSVVWSTSSLKQAQTPLLQLLDTGNLVLTDEKNGNSEDYLWQSFDYPADTLLPGMKFGWDLKRGLNRRLIAWKNWDDPSSGDFILEMTLHNYPEAYLFQGTMRFTSCLSLKDKSLLLRVVPNQTTSMLQGFITAQSVKLYSSLPVDRCDSYGVCGAYGRCIVTESPVCQCLNGFKPKSQQKWDSMDWSQGCVRNKPLNCQEIITHGFVKFPNLKVPDTTYTWVNTSMNLKECREKCLSNCSCTAYTNSDIKEGIGCAIWFGDLLDIKQFPDGGQDLYIRMHPSELGMENGHKKNIAAIVACSIVVVSGMLLGSYYVCSKENLRGIMERIRTIVHSSNNKGPEEDMELPLFDLSTIARATDDFSLNNKLGEGGFGPVYKGVLEDKPNYFLIPKYFSYAADSITQSQSLRDNMTLVSKDGSFELGFFNPGSSKNRYLGIWDEAWNGTSRTGLEWHLFAWKSPDDPSPGELTYAIQHNNYPEVVMKKGSEKYFRTSPWKWPWLRWYTRVKGQPDIRGGGSGCAIWYGDLIDIRQISNGYDANGQDIYIRMHASDLALAALAASVFILGRVALLEKLKNNVMIDQNIEGQREDQELPLFNLATIVATTNNFSSNNKLGEGGFGPVYKGTLTDGQEIAVKRLSRGSGQGLMVIWHPNTPLMAYFQVKSDVFSFGILLLEILGGKKNRGSFHPDHSLNLVGHAWKLWKEGRPLELIDTCLEDSCILSEV